MRSNEKLPTKCLAEGLGHRASDPGAVAGTMHVSYSLSPRCAPSPGATQVKPSSIPILEELTRTWKSKTGKQKCPYGGKRLQRRTMYQLQGGMKKEELERGMWACVDGLSKAGEELTGQPR